MEETRGAALVASPRGPTLPGGGIKETKLPLLLTARPGNVGVQIDAFRTMKMFNRPRCGKFTAQFQGINYENHSMENYSRVVERTQVRTRIVGERLEKLKQHEANLLANEQRRRQRRRERAATEQRRQWLARQADKQVEEREREERAAFTIQRVARGHIARCRVYEIKQHNAATRLQSSMRAFVRKRRSAKQRHDREKERRLHAAKTIQRHARNRQASARHLDATHQPPPENASTTAECDLTPDTDPTASTDAGATPIGPEEPLQTLTVVTTEATDLDLELLLSTSTTTSTVESLTPSPPEPPHPPQPPAGGTAAARPRRPVTIKRVGGGFRQSAAFQSPRLRTSRPPELAQAIAPRPPPPHHHQPRSINTTRATQPPSPKKSPCKAESDADADETALLELVEQLDHAVSALVGQAEPLEQFLEPGTSQPGT